VTAGGEGNEEVKEVTQLMCFYMGEHGIGNLLEPF
jgi:hypothetical protein